VNASEPRDAPDGVRAKPRAGRRPWAGPRPWAGRWLRALALAWFAVAVAACGSGDDGPLVRRVVVFGDSVSDMGTHGVGAIAAVGGGRYTVNPGPVWAERVAQELDYPITVGMTGGFGFAPVECPQPPSCTNWAMGGARVSLHPGIRENPDGSGQLARTIREQIALHLARFGGFDDNEVVSVQGGGNDVFHQLLSIGALVQGGLTFDQALASVVAAMATAGAELAGYVKDDLLRNGARQVVVWNLQDVADTPFGQRLDPQTRALISAMTDAFNARLLGGLAGTAAKIIDTRQLLAQWVANPAAYGFGNVTTEACSRDKIAAVTGGLVQDGASLVCSTQTLIDVDTSRYLFADDVHPAPYAHRLLAETFLAELRRNGWR